MPSSGIDKIRLDLSICQQSEIGRFAFARELGRILVQQLGTERLRGTRVRCEIEGRPGLIDRSLQLISTSGFPGFPEQIVGSDTRATCLRHQGLHFATSTNISLARLLSRYGIMGARIAGCEAQGKAL